MRDARHGTGHSGTGGPIDAISHDVVEKGHSGSCLHWEYLDKINVK